MQFKLLPIILMIAACTGCDSFSETRLSASPADPGHLSMPAADAVAKYGAWLLSQGVPAFDPATFGAKGEYEFNIKRATTVLGPYQEYEYLSVYAGVNNTIIVDIARIGPGFSSMPEFPPAAVEDLRTRTTQYLKTVTGDDYNVVVLPNL